MNNLNFNYQKQIFHPKSSTFDVFITEDLDRFELMRGNRPPNPQHVEHLAKNIEKFGMLCNPILVNEDMQVIDGQHRLLAAKKIGVSIYYIIVKGYNLEQVKALNLKQKNWTKIDFLNSYADMGIESYVFIRQFMQRHLFILNTCLILLEARASTNTYRGTGTSGKFKEGTVKLGDIKKAELYAEQLKILQSYHNLKGRFNAIMITILKNKNFVFSEFLSKLKLQPTALVECATGEQYKQLIEHIYNYRRHNKVNLRF
tara:strand:- start:81 stop:854 length:774 start_codon:yes stop_codon:yes gene_type:complete